MKERERIIVSCLVVLMLVVWLGFVFHQSQRFAGSFWGGLLAVVGGVLMVVPLAYLFVKRISPLKKFTTQFVSMRTLLAWHIYAGIVGPILVLLHTGHKFESPLGIAVTAMTLIVVISGFVGRYLMSQFTQEIREKKSMLASLNSAYELAAHQTRQHPEQAAIVRPFAGFMSRLVAGLFVREDQSTSASGTTGGAPVADSVSPVTAVRLAEAVADVEYAINTHEKCKRWFGKWLKIHIVISVVLYLLMALHVWAAIHFGLRWFD